MNRKGLYSGIVAVMALAVLAGFAFSGQGIVQAEEMDASAETIADFERNIRNIEWVLLKSSADGLADSIWNAGSGGFCSFGAAGAATRIDNYMNAAVTTLALNPAFPSCSVNNVTAVLGGPPDPPNIPVTIDFDLACQRNLGGTIISYRKSYTFIKYYLVWGPPPGLACCISILDEDYGMEFGTCV